MTVRQDGGILTSIPVSKITSVASLTQPSQSNIRPPLAAAVLAPKPEVIESASLSASDQPFFPTSAVLSRMKQCIPPGKVNAISEDSASVMAHGLHSFMKHLLTRLALVVQHRTERLADNPSLEVVDAVRDQLAFLQRLDEHDQARQSDIEKELIFKAAKSRSKYSTEDPDQARVKEMAKRLQNEDYEREKQRQADQTALSAIGGPTKKRRLDEMVPGTASALLAVKRNASSSQLISASTNLTAIGPPGSRLALGPANLRGATTVVSGPKIGSVSSLNGPESSSSASALARVRRANLRDLQFVLSKHHVLNKGSSYFKTYWR
ncbi:Transcription initiation factor TFIID subunit 4B [Cichlidogyrus casuarinus]|uniref:Transcription initiation factor TFIID subunit 4B n=1 Tax=Cichlidogyrus casuarinus TaxID=1844966 RepID=A0ABD2QER6_9PLAT